ncbi:DDE_3 domain-containing protein [Trichonephila clavipes]|uniref:DDE_3 domain-containing protein n=1 Tax=Trichonephila clavipes TaxID=2585209 RepID=A0A8X6VDR8_TRICX|nr:DDE_3 domain-containing protein [Trichonephila clavipes]
MVWSVCSWRDMRPLIRLDTILTDDRYVSLLYDHLHLFMPIVHSEGLGELQQDNVTLHTPRIATYWLQEHSSELHTSAVPPPSKSLALQNPQT